ncbi:MAG TPA: WGR domain-containing protein [Kofleriaceae bacterium]|jgi:uncharacterized protein (TIGR02996 family)
MPRYEFSEGSSSKFWDIKLAGASLTTTFGKIGAKGQTQLKELGSPAAAQKECDRLIAEKTKKGYVLAEGSGAVAKPQAKAKPGGGMYFEFSDGSSNKFWEISLEAAEVTTRYGKIGSDGQSTPKTYKSAGEAKSEHDKLVAEKTKKGYKLVRGSVPAAPVTASAQNPKLEAVIEAAPDDVHGYEVYADWLQGQGDPRGELIALQIGNKTAPAKKVIDQNRAHFYGPMLLDATDMLERFEYHPLGDNTAWRWGYLEKLWISQKFEHSSMHDGEKQEVDVAEALDELLGHPSTRFLRELTVGIESYEDNGYGGVAKIIGKHIKPTLRKLILGDFYSEETELNWSHIGDVTPIYKALRNLESLTLRSGGIKLGSIDLPKLKELRIITGELDKGAFKSVMAAKLPNVERLTLQLGEELAFKVADLQPIFDGRLFPKLVHLGLGNSKQGDAIAAALAGSKIAGQLESIDMSEGTLGDAGALALAGGKFPKLKTIDVTQCYCTSAGINALKKLAKTIEGAKNQKEDDDPDDRYISGRE